MTGFSVTLAGVRGACAGVERAIAAVEAALDRYGPPVHVRRRIVHNAGVVRRLADRGAVFVDDVDDVPAGSVLLISAHGAPPEDVERARRRGLRIVDATCPLVAKVHHEIDALERRGLPVVVVGHEGHDEVAGHVARSSRAHVVASVDDVAALDGPDGTDGAGGIGWVTQTTLSVDDTREVVDAIRDRFPQATGPRGSDICYATQNRQAGVKELARTCDLILVVSDPGSSNGNRLVEVATAAGSAGRMVQGAEDLTASMLDGARHVGVTGAASTPVAAVDEVAAALGRFGGRAPAMADARAETVTFALPEGVGDDARD